MKKTLGVLFIIAAVGVLLFFFGPGNYYKSFKMRSTYENATQYMVDGNYQQAAELFDSIPSYEDSANLAMYCKANQLAEEGKYVDAIKAFGMLDGYKDSKYLLVYCQGCMYENSSSEQPELLAEAAEQFDAVYLFRDSSARAEECRKQLYDIAKGYLGDGDYNRAMEYFELLDDYADSADQVLECNYQLAIKTMKEGQLSDAISMFRRIEDYKDSQNRIKQSVLLQNIEIRPICELMNDEEYTLFEYEDATYYIDDEADGLLFGHWFSVKNLNEESMKTNISCYVDGQESSAQKIWQPKTTEIGEEVFCGFVNKGEDSAYFEPGEHYCDWYVNDVHVYHETYTVKEGESELRKNQVKAAEKVKVEYFIAEFDDDKEEFSNLTAAKKASISSLEFGDRYIYVLKVTNTSRVKIGVNVSAKIDTDRLRWDGIELNSSDSINLYSDKPISLGKHSVQVFVNGIKHGEEWTFEILE